MALVLHFRWRIPTLNKPGKTHLAAWEMTESEALRRYPTAVKVGGPIWREGAGYRCDPTRDHDGGNGFETGGVMDWISVKDRLPEGAGEYLVAIGETGWGRIIQVLDWNYSLELAGWSSWFDRDSLQIREDAPITHWMPLPPIPHPVDSPVP